MGRPRRDVTYSADDATVRALFREARLRDQAVRAQRRELDTLNSRARDQGVDALVLQYMRRIWKAEPARRRELIALSRQYLAVLEAEADPETPPGRPAA